MNSESGDAFAPCHTQRSRAKCRGLFDDRVAQYASIIRTPRLSYVWNMVLLLYLLAETLCQTCAIIPSFLVVGSRAQVDTDVDSLAATTISQSLRLTGYFKLNTNSTYSCNGTMVTAGSGLSTTFSYSIVASLEFSNGSFIAFALRPGPNASSFDALVIRKYALYSEMSVLGVLDSNAGFVEFCKLTYSYIDGQTVVPITLAISVYTSASSRYSGNFNALLNAMKGSNTIKILFRKFNSTATPCYRGSLYNWQFSNTPTSSIDLVNNFDLNKQYAFYDQVTDHMVWRFKEWTLPGYQYVNDPNDLTQIALVLTADSTSKTTPTVADSYSNTDFIFRGRNSAVLFVKRLISQTQLLGDGFNFVVSLGFNIIHQVTNYSQLTDFCSKIIAGTFADIVRKEPIYEVILGTSTFGIYHEIISCGSPDTKTTKLYIMVDGVQNQVWNNSFDSSSNLNKNYTVVFSFQKTPLSDDVDITYSISVMSGTNWVDLSNNTFKLTPGLLTVDSLVHGFGNIKKTVIPAEYVSVFEYEFANVVTTIGGKAQHVSSCTTNRGTFDQPKYMAQLYNQSGGGAPMPRPLNCATPGLPIASQGCLNLSISGAPSAIPNCYLPTPQTVSCIRCVPGYFNNPPNQCNTCPANCFLCLNSTSCLQCKTGFIKSNSAGNYICIAFIKAPNMMYVPAMQSAGPSTNMIMSSIGEGPTGVFTSNGSINLTVTGAIWVQFDLNMSAGYGLSGGNYDVRLYIGNKLVDVSTIPIKLPGATDYLHQINAYHMNVNRYDTPNITLMIQAATNFTIANASYGLNAPNTTLTCSFYNAAGECLTCNGLLGKYTARGDQTKCSTPIPAGFYIVPQYLGYYESLASCDANCATCVGNSTNCTTCPSTTPLLISDYNDPSVSRCLAVCPLGWYNDYSRCKKCDPTCASCNGTGNASCLSCPSDRLLSSQGCINSNSCCYLANITNCQAYSADGTCFACIDGHQIVQNMCASSTDYNSQSIDCRFKNTNPGFSCYECNVAAGYYLPNSTSPCMRVPSGFYVSASTFGINDTLSACDSTAANCGNCSVTATNCSSCQPQYYLYGNTCLSTCPENFGPSPNNTCQPCSPRCAACMGTESNQCLTCQNNFAPSTIGCAPSSGQFCCYSISQVPNCQTPSSDNNCSVCNEGHTLIRGYCVPTGELTAGGSCLYQPAGGSCMICNWDAGYYLNSTLNCSLIPTGFVATQGAWGSADLLVACVTGCASCIGNSTNCTNCSSNYFESLNSTTQGPKICIAACPVGYYGDNTTKKCASCDPRCSTCNGSRAKDCLTCAVGLLPINQTSSPSCEANLPATCCVNCSIQNCMQCSADGVCLACANTYQLNNNTCTASLKKQNKVTIFARFDSLNRTYILTFSQPVNLTKMMNVSSLVYPSSMFSVDFQCFNQTILTAICSSKINFIDNIEVYKQNINLVILKPVAIGGDAYVEAQTVGLDIPITFYMESAKSLKSLSTASRSIATVGAVSSAPLLVTNANSFSGFIRLTQTIEFLVYLNIIFPANYKSFVQFFSQGIFDITYNPFDVTGDDANSEALLGWTFLENDLRERYLANVGQYSLIFTVVIFVKLFAILACRITKNSSGWIKSKLQALNDYLSPNVAFTLLESAFVDFVMAAMLNLKYGNVSTLYDGINYALSLLTILLLCLEMALVFHYSHIMHRGPHQPLESEMKFELFDRASDPSVKGPTRVNLDSKLDSKNQNSKIQGVNPLKKTPSELGLQTWSPSELTALNEIKPDGFNARMLKLYKWADLEDLLDLEDAGSLTGRYKTFVGQLKAFLTVVILVMAFDSPIFQVVGVLILQVLPTICICLKKPHKNCKENFKTYLEEVSLSCLMFGAFLMLDFTGLLQSPAQRYLYMGNAMIAATGFIFLYAILSNLFDSGKFVYQYLAAKKKNHKIEVLPVFEPAKFKESTVEGFTPLARNSMLSQSGSRIQFSENAKNSMPSKEPNKFNKQKVMSRQIFNIEADIHEPEPSPKMSPESPQLHTSSTKNTFELKEPVNRPSSKKSLLAVKPGPANISPTKSTSGSNTLYAGLSTLSLKPKKIVGVKISLPVEPPQKMDGSPSGSHSPKLLPNPSPNSMSDSLKRNSVNQAPAPDVNPRLVEQPIPAESTQSGFVPLKASKRLQNIERTEKMIKDSETQKLHKPELKNMIVDSLAISKPSSDN